MHTYYCPSIRNMIRKSHGRILNPHQNGTFIASTTFRSRTMTALKWNNIILLVAVGLLRHFYKLPGITCALVVVAPVIAIPTAA